MSNKLQKGTLSNFSISEIKEMLKKHKQAEGSKVVSGNKEIFRNSIMETINERQENMENDSKLYKISGKIFGKNTNEKLWGTNKLKREDSEKVISKSNSEASKDFHENLLIQYGNKTMEEFYSKNIDEIKEGKVDISKIKDINNFFNENDKSFSNMIDKFDINTIEDLNNFFDVNYSIFKDPKFKNAFLNITNYLSKDEIVELLNLFKSSHTASGILNISNIDFRNTLKYMNSSEEVKDFFIKSGEKEDFQKIYDYMNLKEYNYQQTTDTHIIYYINSNFSKYKIEFRDYLFVLKAFNKRPEKLFSGDKGYFLIEMLESENVKKLIKDMKSPEEFKKYYDSILNDVSSVDSEQKDETGKLKVAYYNEIFKSNVDKDTYKGVEESSGEILNSTYLKEQVRNLDLLHLQEQKFLPRENYDYFFSLMNVKSNKDFLDFEEAFKGYGQIDRQILDSLNKVFTHFKIDTKEEKTSLIKVFKNLPKMSEYELENFIKFSNNDLDTFKEFSLALSQNENIKETSQINKIIEISEHFRVKYYSSDNYTYIENINKLISNFNKGDFYDKFKNDSLNNDSLNFEKYILFEKSMMHSDQDYETKNILANYLAESNISYIYEKTESFINNFLKLDKNLLYELQSYTIKNKNENLLEELDYVFYKGGWNEFIKILEEDKTENKERVEEFLSKYR